MYCPNCGAESTLGLNYCKHCGGNLSETTAPPAPGVNILAALILAAATVGTVLGGLAIVFRMALSLIGPQPEGFTPPVQGVVAVAGMMVIFGSFAIMFLTMGLIKLFSRVMGFGSASEKPARTPKTLPPPVRQAQVPGQPIGMLSVTEHTTRNFEPRVYQRDTSE